MTEMTPAECRAEALRLLEESDRNEDYPHAQKHLMRKAQVYATLATGHAPAPFTADEAAQLANLLGRDAVILSTGSAKEETLLARAREFFATVARS